MKRPRSNSIGAATGKEFAYGSATILFIALLCFFISAAVFGIHILFYGPEARIAQFKAFDIVLRQKIYNASNARATKDTALLQQIDQLRQQLTAEIPVRQAEFDVLQENITTETGARIASEQVLFYGIANETDAREAADVIIAEGVQNVTTGVQNAEAYDIFSNEQFMIKMANITAMDNLLMGEIVGRMTKRQQLSDAGALADSTIAYLIMQLAKEIHTRTIYDTLISQELNYLSASVLVVSINMLNGTNGNMNIVSSTPATLTITTTAGLLTFVNHGICTINGVSPNSGTGNTAFTAGTGILIDTVSVPANSWRISSTVNPVPPNYSTLDGVFSGLGASPPSIDQSDPNRFWQSIPCSFPNFNGGPCGWTAPDTGTYIIQVIATFTVIMDGGSKNSLHVSLGLGIGTLSVIGNNPLQAVPETGGNVFMIDSVHLGDYRSPSTLVDVTLSGTVVIQGGGTDTTGCGIPPNCGYGVRVFYKATNGFVAFNNYFIPAVASVSYRWTKAS